MSATGKGNSGRQDWKGDQSQIGSARWRCQGFPSQAMGNLVVLRAFKPASIKGIHFPLLGLSLH